MTDQLAVSMRASSLGVRDCMGECSLHRFERIQINALHQDFKDLSDSGRRDVVATLRRNGLRASGVDFLVPPAIWEKGGDQALAGFGVAVSIAEAVGRVPVSVCLPEEPEIVETVIATGIGAGVLVAAHASMPLENPNIGWGLPISLLAKEDRPLRTLAESTYGPIALRLSGDIQGRTTLETNDNTLELTELRGLLDAMRWKPSPVIDATPEEATLIAAAWHAAGPWQI